MAIHVCLQAIMDGAEAGTEVFKDFQLVQAEIGYLMAIALLLTLVLIVTMRVLAKAIVYTVVAGAITGLVLGTYTMWSMYGPHGNFDIIFEPLLACFSAPPHTRSGDFSTDLLSAAPLVTSHLVTSRRARPRLFGPPPHGCAVWWIQPRAHAWWMLIRACTPMRGPLTGPVQVRGAATLCAVGRRRQQHNGAAR